MPLWSLLKPQHSRKWTMLILTCYVMLVMLSVYHMRSGKQDYNKYACDGIFRANHENNITNTHQCSFNKLLVYQCKRRERTCGLDIFALWIADVITI